MQKIKANICQKDNSTMLTFTKTEFYETDDEIQLLLESVNTNVNVNLKEQIGRAFANNRFPLTTSYLSFVCKSKYFVYLFFLQ